MPHDLLSLVSQSVKKLWSGVVRYLPKVFLLFRASVVRPVALIVGEKQDEFHAPVKKSVAMMIFALGEEVDSWSHHCQTKLRVPLGFLSKEESCCFIARTWRMVRTTIVRYFNMQKNFEDKGNWTSVGWFNSYNVPTIGAWKTRASRSAKWING